MTLSERVTALEDQSENGSILPAIRSPEELEAFLDEIRKRPCDPPRKLTDTEQRKADELDQWFYKSIGVTK